MNKINPQEIYLLERYTSLAYFGEMRDAWGEMIEHVEACLDRFVHNLPLDYRNRPLPEQPDIVWGERVLPNFRDTFQGLCDGYIRLSHGDTTAFGWANGPLGDFKGQSDFWSGWMDEANEKIYRDLLSAATDIAMSIMATENAYWDAGELGERYDPEARGPLNAPAQWPQYRLKPSVHVTAGVAVPQTGIYVPSLDNSCAQYLSQALPEAPEASVFIRMEVNNVMTAEHAQYLLEQQIGSAKAKKMSVANSNDYLKTHRKWLAEFIDGKIKLTPRMCDPTKSEDVRGLIEITEAVHAK